ncbi:MAG: LysR substrate-binding domain-containing protein [Clostridium sp.]|nr:LysR substrate-binding domain-containing protein [Clostridium sp.]
MELRQLKYFVRSAETLNFTEAARTLFITESTLSLQIKQLEVELNTQLFERVRRTVYLTEAGEVFLPYARRTLLDAEHATQKLDELKNLHTGYLRIGVTYSLSSLLTDTLVRFSKTYPGITLDVEYRTATDLQELLKNRQVDFVLSYEPLKPEKQMEMQRLFDAQLSVIVHRHHPLAALKRATIQQLSRYPLVLPSRGLNARSMLDNILQTKGEKLIPCMELNEVNILLRLIRMRHWVTVLSSATVRNEDELKAVPLADKVEMHAALLWMKDGMPKHSAREFMRMLLPVGQSAESLARSLP